MSSATVRTAQEDHLHNFPGYSSRSAERKIAIALFLEARQRMRCHVDMSASRRHARGGITKAEQTCVYFFTKPVLSPFFSR